MADNNYRLAGSVNPAQDWTSEVILEKDDETGEVTKSVSATVPAQLNKEDLDLIESLGLKVEKVSASDAKEAQREAVATAASDTLASGPILGGSDVGVSAEDDQSDDESDEKNS